MFLWLNCGFRNKAILTLFAKRFRSHPGDYRLVTYSDLKINPPNLKAGRVATETARRG